MARRARTTSPVRLAVEQVGGITAAAHLCGVRERTIARWMTDGMVPDSVALFRLADAAKVPPRPLALPDE